MTDSLTGDNLKRYQNLKDSEKRDGSLAKSYD